MKRRLKRLVLVIIVIIMTVMLLDFSAIIYVFNSKKMYDDPFQGNTASIYETPMESVNQPISSIENTITNSISNSDVKVPIVMDPTEWKLTGALVSIFTFSLQDEEDWSEKQPTHHNENWEDRYESLLESTQAKYEQTEDREFIDDEKDLSHSSFKINWVEDMGSSYIYSNRVCRDVKTHKYYFYSDGKKNMYFGNQPRSFFRWGINVEEKKHEEFPDIELTHEEKGLFVFEPFLTKHITHFIETVNHLLNKLGDRSLYPYLSTLYLPWFDENSEYEWSKTYLQLLLSLFPSEYRPKVVFKNVYEDAGLECFKSVVLLDRLAYNNDGGVFGGFFPQDLMRGVSYKYAGVTNQNGNRRIQLLFLKRESSRKWMRKKQYLNAINATFPMVDVTKSSLKHLSFAEQVQLFSSMDIILGGHGSAMTNVMFMFPHSVLIECYPPFFYELCFGNIAMISRVHYISVNNFNDEYLPNGLKDAHKKGVFFKDRRQYARFNIYPNPLEVVSAVDDAVEYISHWRFSYMTNKEWSSVFY